MAYQAHPAGEATGKSGTKSRFLICRIDPAFSQTFRHTTRQDPLRGLPGPAVLEVEGPPDLMKRLDVADTITNALNGQKAKAARKPERFFWSGDAETPDQAERFFGSYHLHVRAGKQAGVSQGLIGLVVMDPADKGLSGMVPHEFFADACTTLGLAHKREFPAPRRKKALRPTTL